jgi:hypothetical protein
MGKLTDERLINQTHISRIESEVKTPGRNPNRISKEVCIKDRNSHFDALIVSSL